MQVSTTRQKIGFAAALVALSVVTVPALGASPEARTRCTEQHRQAQLQRSASRLLEARDGLLQCAAKECPGLIQQDCAEWLVEVRQSIPSVVPVAKSRDGRELIRVRVALGDRVVANGLDGRPIELDPGPYTFRFESPDGVEVNVDFVAAEGVKNRLVEVTFPPGPGEAGQAAPAPAAFWVLAATGAVALTSFGVFAALGESRYRDLESECAPRCSASESDSVRTKFLIADISLGVAAITSAGAAYLYLSRDGASPHTDDSIRSADRNKPLTVVVSPTAGGVYGALRAAF